MKTRNRRGPLRARPGREFIRESQKKDQKEVTRGEFSAMIEPIGGFCNGKNETKKTKKTAGKKSSRADAGSICTGHADSGRRDACLPV